MNRRTVRQRRLAGAVALALALPLAACGNSNSDGDSDTASGGADPSATAGVTSTEKFEFSVQSVYGPDAEQTKGLTQWTEAVTEGTNGNVTFEFAYGPTLAPLAEVAEAMESGLIDIALGLPVYSPDQFPINATLAELAHLTEASPVFGTLQGAAFMETGFQEEVVGEIEAAGVKVLNPMWMYLNEYTLICKGEPITTLAEAKGRKVRVPGSVWGNEIEALGMEPVFIPSNEQFDAYQRGLFDCIVQNWGDMVHTGLLQESDFLMSDPEVGLTGWASVYLGMGQDQWDSLPLDYQQVFWDNLSVHNDRFVHSGFVNSKLAAQVIKDKGIEVVPFQDDFRTALREYQESNVDSVKQRLEGKVKDPDALVDGLVKDVEEMGTTLRDDLGMGKYEEFKSWNEWVQDSGDGEVDLTTWLDHIQENIYGPRRPE
jgi:TRAP-type C4-dicarboxylate transport system substrate-binding protein